MSSRDQFHALLNSKYGTNINTVYIENFLFDELSLDDYKGFLDNNPSASLSLALPYVLRNTSEKRILSILNSEEFKEFFTGVLVRSLDEIGFIKSMNLSKEIILTGDAGLYTWNKESFEAFKDDIHIETLPYELKREEYRYLECGDVPLEKIIYGRVPMMITANCVVKTSFECRNGKDNGFAFLTDRTNTAFPVKVNCKDCSNIIYNSVPLSLHDTFKYLKNEYMCRLNFTTESEEEVLKVLGYFVKGINDNKKAPYEYTTGHEKKGVE